VAARILLVIVDGSFDPAPPLWRSNEMHTAEKLRRILLFLAGAAAATIVSDVALIALSNTAAPHAKGLVHHVEFLATLMALVGLAGAVGLQLSPQRDFRPATLVGLGAVAAVIGYAIGVALAPLAGPTMSIAAIALAAAAVPAVAARWAPTR
jgi:hypothetical protein